ADALTVEVDIGQLNADFVTDLQNVGNLVDALVADLTDVNQTVDARHDADKGAKLGDGDNGSGELGADGHFILQLDPRIVLFLLVAQRHLQVFGIVALDVNFDLVANIDNLRGMLDVGPAQLADMAQAIHTADIHESAVRGQALDNALILLANFNIGPELFALGLVG